MPMLYTLPTNILANWLFQELQLTAYAKGLTMAKTWEKEMLWASLETIKTATRTDGKDHEKQKGKINKQGGLATFR